MTYDPRPFCAICDRRVEKAEWPEHQAHVVSSQATQRVGAIVDENRRLSNALRWIRMQAGMHFLGAAFDPEHMRALADLAADALSGTGEIADFDTVMAEAQDKAAQRAEEMSAHIEAGETRA